jgi:dihydrolipoamide dehydrogenase
VADATGSTESDESVTGETEPGGRKECDVLIIGGGPGGYVCGIRAGQLGLKVIVVDGQPLGGTCLNVGCIPSKAVIHAAEEYEMVKAMASTSLMGISVDNPSVDLAATRAWKDSIVARLNRGVGALLNRLGAEVLVGWATLIDGKTARVHLTARGGDEAGSAEAGGGPADTITVSAEHVVIATGSVPVELPNLPFGGDVLSSTEALDLDQVPQRLAVVGGGYIGMELGLAMAKFGSRITVVEALDRVLAGYDKRLTTPVTRTLSSLGGTVLTRTKALAMTSDGLLVEGPDGQQPVPADKVLVTVGRRPQTEGWGLENLGLTMDGPFLAVDERCRTSMRQVWAVGDITGEPMLAHRAMKQGEVVAEAIAGMPAVFDSVAIPAIVFTDPEIVAVGLGPDEAARHVQALGTKVVEGRFSLAANGRTMTIEPTEPPGHKPGSAVNAGFVRVVARADNHLVLGIQAVGTGVAELSAAFGLAIESGARLEDIAGTIHAHPTIGEGLAEAAMAALGHAIHG